MKKIILIFSILLFTITTNAQQLWLGSYTPNREFGIRILNFDPTNGSLQVMDSIKIPQASFLTYSKKGILYAVEENLEGKVHAIKSNGKNGYEIFSTQLTNGMHPCYIALDKTEQWLTVGNYSSGNLSLYKIGEDGSIQSLVSTQQHYGKGTNKDRQESPHVHSTVFTPDNKFLLVPDLGIDTVKVYSFDELNGKLTPEYSKNIIFENGGGPRHISFHPNGKWLYILGELSGKIQVYEYIDNQFIWIENISSIPNDYTGTFSGADIHTSKNGRHLYLTLRDQLNSIVYFDIKKNGKLKKRSTYSTQGNHPRNFYISKDDEWVFVENKNSNKIVVFKRDKKTGKLKYNSQLDNILQPVCLIDK